MTRASTVDPSNAEPSPPGSARASIFISHIALEGKMADVLKREIEAAFEGAVKVYVSSSPELVPKLAAAVDKSDEVVDETLGDLDDGGYVSSGGLGYLPFQGYSLTEKGRDVLRRLTGPPPPTTPAAAA